MYYLLLPSLAVRSRLIAHLKARGILAVFHYLPLHLSPMGRKLGGVAGECPVAEDVSERLLRLPMYVGLGDGEQDEVIAALEDFRAW
jgi:dTDP-4-amino-4,6-dideoxygalactose transaminase